MKLPKSATKKLQERVASLEEHLGVVYATGDGYPEHLNREYGLIPRIKDEVKELTRKTKK